MDTTNALILWRYHDAPKDLQELVSQGGDEDMLIYAAPLVKDKYFSFLLSEVLDGSENSYLTNWGHVERRELPDGAVVVSFAHA